MYSALTFSFITRLTLHTLIVGPYPYRTSEFTAYHDTITFVLFSSQFGRVRDTVYCTILIRLYLWEYIPVLGYLLVPRR